MRLIGAICVYNEQDRIYKALEQVHKIRDLDCVHVQDGAWRYGGSSANSTESTEAEIERFRNDHPWLKVYYEKNPLEEPFENESAKRNFQLLRIDMLLAPKNVPYYVFSMDADEEIKFPDGRDEVWIKEGLNVYADNKACGALTVYAAGGTEPIRALRFIPGKRGIHYFTGVPNVVHDRNHKLLMDYNLDKQLRDTDHVWVIPDFFLVNHAERTGQRLQDKINYLGVIEAERPVAYSRKCTWSPV